MATDDQQVLVAGTASAPCSFTVPGNGQIRPKTVRAVYNGSAAATFMPVLRIVSDGGVIVAEAPGLAIAAGGSAAVTWFPGAELDSAALAGLPITESLYLNSTAASVTASTVLQTGVSYLLSVQGTYSAWNLDLDNGTPQPAPIFPPASSAGRVSTEVGVDAETLFAWPTAHPHVAGHDVDFQMDLGSGFAHVEPYDGAHTTPTADNFYTYQVTGQGSAPSFRLNDPLADNYGLLKITIYGIPGGTSGGGAGVASVTAADTSIVVGGTAVNPTVRTATLDVIAADHPPVAAVAMNAQKITGLANGVNPQDAATFSQVSAGGVSSVTAADTSIVIAGTGANPTVATGTLDVIAADHPPAADVSMNSHKITNLANGVGAQDAATVSQINAGTVVSVTAADASIVVGGTGANPTVATGTLDVIAAQHPAAADWSNNSHKITSLANGVAGSDAATVAQLGSLPSFDFTVLVKGGDTSRASTTVLAIDPDLQFVGTNHGCYIFYFFPVYGSPAGAGTPDIKFALGEDASARGGWRGLGVSTADAIADISLTATNNTTSVPLGTATTDRGAYIYGFHTSVGGTFGIFWAQNVSGVNATILRTGSKLLYALIGT